MGALSSGSHYKSLLNACYLCRDPSPPLPPPSTQRTIKDDNKDKEQGPRMKNIPLVHSVHMGPDVSSTWLDVLKQTQEDHQACNMTA